MPFYISVGFHLVGILSLTWLLRYWLRKLLQDLDSPARQTVADGTCILPDGRHIAYNVYGAEAGHPVFYLHGFPGSRFEGALFALQAEKLGVKIIAMDRPGIGLSTAHPDRTVLSHARDITHLAKQLDIKTYSVLGVSGGGQYALACAFLHPSEQLRSVALVCGMGPIDIGLRGMKLGNQIIMRAFQHYPAVFRMFMQLGASRRLKLKLVDNDLMSNEKVLALYQMSNRWNLFRLPEKDTKVMANPEMIIFFRSLKEHFRQGVCGWSEEGRVITSYLGFDLRDVKRNVRLWYGSEDDNVPVVIGEEIARRLGANGSLKVVPETHLSMVFNRRNEILQDLLKAAS